MVFTLQPEQLSELEGKIAYTFKDRGLLKTALTHSSAVHGVKTTYPCNERLEFLGDAVLELSVSDYIYQHRPDLDEGALSRLRANLVCEDALFFTAGLIALPTYLRLGKGEEATGGREKPSVVSDAFEALIGAIYLDGGFSAAYAFVLRFVINAQKERVHASEEKDDKTLLQEYVQSKHLGELTYSLIREEGPDHCKAFYMETRLNGRVIGMGSGRSKKAAGEDAARSALIGLTNGEITAE